ncbi:hypothetical protein BD289DRAFT_495930 [Coniella lustricola]|uniref:Uncharacterized protein n=1 Tax=Coniella lustricola TaxID=2025994 RepID=A0A2T3ADD0_9PEZI|nr:hypothetical protein BD289DRAFT_495930 [Coniella lustricola]
MDDIWLRRNPGYEMPWANFAEALDLFLKNLRALIIWMITMGLIVLAGRLLIEAVVWVACGLYRVVVEFCKQRRVVPGAENIVNRLLARHALPAEGSDAYLALKRFHAQMMDVVEEHWGDELQGSIDQQHSGIDLDKATYIIVYMAASQAKFEDRNYLMFRDLEYGYKGFRDLSAYNRRVLLEHMPLSYAP